MPIRGLDFSQSNRAIARFREFLQMDVLDQFRSDRDVDIMKIQDRLMRERQVSGGEVEMGVARYKSALSEKEAYLKAMIEIDKLPELEHLVALAHMATNPNLPPEYHAKSKSAVKKYAELIIPYAEAFFNESRGIGTAPDIRELLRGGGTETAVSMVREGGLERRSIRAADLEREKLGLEEEGKGVKLENEQRKEYVDWIDKTVSHIQQEGVVGKTMMDVIIWATGGRYRDPLSREARGKVLRDLNILKSRLIAREPLTQRNIDYITKVWNAAAIEGAGEGEGERLSPAAGGGVPSIDTGLTEGETAGVNEAARSAAIAHYAEKFIQEVYGGRRDQTTNQEALRVATEFVDTKIYPRK